MLIFRCCAKFCWFVCSFIAFVTNMCFDVLDDESFCCCFEALEVFPVSHRLVCGCSSFSWWLKSNWTEVDVSQVEHWVFEEIKSFWYGIKLSLEDWTKGGKTKYLVGYSTSLIVENEGSFNSMIVFRSVRIHWWDVFMVIRASCVDKLIDLDERMSDAENSSLNDLEDIRW